jgi:hypothetical protein
MTTRQQKAYQEAVKALAANHKAEQEQKRAEFAAALKDVSRRQTEVLRQLDLAHQREWFALRTRSGFPIGPAGQHLLKEPACTRHTK